MNEDGTPIVEQEANIEEPSTENISAADGGVGTTPDEVAELLNLPKPEKVEEEEEIDEDAEAAKAAEEAEAKEQAAKTEQEKAAADAKKAEDEAAKKTTTETAANEDVPTFELEVEDANGEKVTLKPGDKLEDVLKDFEPKNNGQIFQIIDDLHQLRAEKEKYDADAKVKAEEEAHTTALQEINDGWNKEIEALQGDKRIPVTTDDKHSERVDEVFKFMGEENAKREEDGRPFIRSFEDALDKLELRESKEAEAKKAKEEKELTKKKGAMVGGSSAPATSGAPVYKGGARNANEAIRHMGLLK